MSLSFSHPFSPEVALALAGLFFFGILPATIWLIVWLRHRHEKGRALFSKATKREVKPERLWPQLLPRAPSAFERTLAWAGYRRPAPRRGTLLLLFLLLLFILTLVFGKLGVIIAVAAAGGCYHFVVRRASRARAKFIANLPDGLTSLADALKAGYSLPQAIAFVSGELEEPLASVFGALVRAEHYQLSFAESLTRVGNQLNVPEWTLVVETLVAQKTIGGNTIPLLKEISGIIHDRTGLEQEMKTLTAAGKLSGYIIAGLVPVMLIFFALVSPDYLRPMFATTMGQILLSIAVILELVGFIWIRQLVKLDY
jgi:Flp pilus assembly protein TadB